MTKSMEHQLVDYGRHLQSLVDDMVVPIAKEAPARIQPASKRRRGWRVALAAFVVPLVLIGGLVYFLRPSEDQQPVVTATTPSTIAPQPEPTTAPEPTVVPQPEATLPALPSRDIAVGWSRVPHDVDVFGGGFEGTLSAVTLGGPGLVTVGNTCNDLVNDKSVCEAGAWVSADASTWQRVPGGEDLFGAGALGLTDVAASSSGVVAVTECSGDGNLAALCDPGMWFSPDGMTWDPVELSSGVFEGCSTPGSPPRCVTYWNTVVAGGPGFVAAGRDLRGPGIWASTDGREWARVTDPDMFPEGFFEIWTLGVAGPRIVAIATQETDVFNEEGEWISMTTNTYAWTSLDAFSWEPVPDPDGALTSGLIFYNLVEWDGGLAAVGWACIEGDTCEVVWTSPDGLTWSYAQLPGVAAGMTIQGVVAGEPGLIVWGEGRAEEDGDGNPTGVPVGYFWTSSDGVTWQRHTADAEVFGYGMPIWEFVWYEDVLIGVGSSPEDRAPAIYRWNP